MEDHPLSFTTIAKRVIMDTLKDICEESGLNHEDYGVEIKFFRKADNTVSDFNIGVNHG